MPGRSKSTFGVRSYDINRFDPKLQKENGMTVVSIAHRLSTLKNTDEIFVFDRGEIVQRGKYDKLKEQPGIFQDMYLGKLK